MLLASAANGFIFVQNSHRLLSGVCFQTIENFILLDNGLIFIFARFILGFWDWMFMNFVVVFYLFVDQFLLFVEFPDEVA